MDFYNDKLKEAFLKFKEAEKAIKSAETIRADVYTAAINQLRYASNHLITYIEQVESGDCSGAEESLQKFFRHCTRSFYDAYDSEATFILKQYYFFCKYSQERGIAISSLFHDKFEAWSKASKNLSTFIKAGQFNNITKEEKYKKIAILLKECEDCGLYDLEWAYDVVNDQISALNNIKEENQHVKKVALWSCIFGGFSLLVALIALFYSA